ncbi:MAG: VPLPA-CTERM-specific exosortase XrtD [Terriglobales bacterium]
MLRLQGWSLLLLVVWLYYSILCHLGIQWISDPNFSHGIFVPAFSLFVLWQDREKLKNLESEPSWLGFPLIVLALLMLVLGVLGVELFTSRLSLLVLLAGIILLFRGRAFFRAVLFPWAFLILMIPLPNLILQKFTFPLQMLASKMSTFMLQLIGVPALREGNVIHLPYMSLEVAEACSGIRSLLSLLTLAIIYGYLMEKRNWVRIVLACAAVPIAVIANGLRIFGTGIVGEYWDPDKAQGFFHEFQGWLIFVVTLILLFAMHRLINLIWKPIPDSGGKPASPPTRHADLANGVEKRSHVQGSVSMRSPRFLVPALLMFATAVGLQAHSQEEVFPPRQPLSALPAQIDGWTGTDETLDQPTLDILGPGEFLVRDYENASQPQPWISLFIAYFPSQKMGDTIHSPNHCLPGAGWVPTVKQIVQLKAPDGTTFPVNRYVVSKAGDRQIVLYWFQAHGRAVASEYSAKYYLIADSIRMHRSDGALIRFMSPMYPGESPDDAQARVMGLGNHFLPVLNNYIPR